MDCCSVNGLNKVFNESKARKESEAYSSKGLGKRARCGVSQTLAQRARPTRS